MAVGGYVFRAFRSNRRRNLLGIAAVVVTVCLMVLVGVLFNVALGTITELLTRETGYDILVSPTSQGLADLSNLSYLDVDRVTQAMKRGGAEEAYPLVTQVVLGYPKEPGLGNGSLLVLYGAKEGYDVGLELEMEGDYDLDGDGCVVSSEAAQDLEVGLDDVIQVIGFKGELNLSANLSQLLLDPEFQRNLVYDNWTVRGIIDVQGRFLQGVQSYIVKDLGQVQTMYEIEGKASLVVGTVDQDLYDLNDPDDPAGEVFDVGERIALDLGPEFLVSAPKGQAIEASLQASSATNVIAYMFSVVFPIIAGIMIASILNLSVEERAKDLATMRLLGARRSEVGKVVVGELALMLVVGIPIGVGLGVGFPALAHVAGAEELPEDFSQVVDWGVVLGQVLITLVITGLFAITPLRKAMATAPAEAISQIRVEGRYRFISTRGVDRRFLAAAFIIFLALLYGSFFVPYLLIMGGERIFTFFIFSFLSILLAFCIWLLVAVPFLQRGLVAITRPLLPRVHKLVRANLGRYVRRNASTTLIFAIIVAILLFFSSFFAAIQQSVERSAMYELGSDVVMFASDVLPLELVEGVAGANFSKAVAATTPELEGRLSNVVGSRGEGVDIFALWGDMTRASFVSDDDVHRGDLGVLADVGPDGCVVSRGLASALEVGVGDKVALTFEDQRRFISVHLILESMPGFAGDFPEEADEAGGSGVFVSIATYAELIEAAPEEVPYEKLFVKVAEGEDHEEVGRTLQQRYRVFFSFFVVVTSVVVEEAEEGLRVLNVLFFFILTILMAVAFFSLYMNLLASILEREFELGIIRSLGLRASALRNALVAEGVVTALVAMFIGILVGTTFSTLIIAFFNMLSPIDFTYAVPWVTLITLAVMTLGLSVLATYPPARSVSGRAVVELIRRAA